MAEHHHDHSNCNHDHHDNSAKKASEVVNGELTARQKAAEKLNKVQIGFSVENCKTNVFTRLYLVYMN